MNLKKIVLIALVVIVAAASVYGYMIYRDIFSANTKFEEAETYVYVPTDATFSDVQKLVSPYVENMDRFTMVAKKKSYDSNVKAGKFLLKKGMNSNDIINSLRQSLPVKLAFNNQETLEDFAHPKK